MTAPSFFRALSCALCLAATTLGAQPAPPNGAPPRASSPPSDDARLHYQAATRFYELRRYDDAAREFESAYALTRRAELLFNIGRAYEDGGRNAEALLAYERFELAGAPGVERAQFDRRVASLRASLAGGREARTPSPGAASSAPSPHAEAQRPGPNRTLPLALMIGGGAALAGAIAVGVTAASTHASLERDCAGAVCPASRADDITSGRTRAIIADVVGVVGVTSLVAGVVVWALQGSRGARPTASLSCSSEACGPAALVTF